MVALFAAVLFAAACGDEAPRPMPQILEATAARDMTGGQALPSTTIAVRMDRDFSLASTRTPLASHFELLIHDVLGDSGNPTFVQTATRSADDPRLFILEVSRLVPEGTTLSISRRAFREGDLGTLDAEVGSELTSAQAFFAETQFRFHDPAILGGAAGAGVSDPDEQDLDVQREALRDHLLARGANAEAIALATARFDALPEAIIPSPKLRAAVAALTGTFAEPAHDYLVSDQNCTGEPASLVAFQPPPGRPELLARSTRADDGRLVISINPRLIGERIEHLMPVLAHEAIHCDDVDGLFEEVAATAFDTLLYIELLVKFPELPFTGTELARELNIDALAMLNSGRLIPESGGVLPSAGLGPALPGSDTDYRSFADLVAASYSRVSPNDSPAETIAVAYAGALAARTGMALDDPFNLVYLDELIARSFSADMLISLLETLGLEPA